MHSNAEDTIYTGYHITSVSSDGETWNDIIIGDTPSSTEEKRINAYENQYKSCTDIKNNVPTAKDGEYIIYPYNDSRALNVYCEMTSNGGGWTRMYYKNGANTCFSSKVYNENMTLFSNISSIGISESLTTMNIEKSWIINSPALGTLTSFVYNTNCKTPTNTEWSQSYNTGTYTSIRGTLATNGSWINMFFGCSQTRDIGTVISLRIGGGLYHEGEFIHGSCNDYTTNNNSITSRWDWEGIKAFWIKN